jgi:hypothetical protein
MRVRPLSPWAQKVLQAPGARPCEWRYGYELGERMHLLAPWALGPRDLS